MWIFTKDGFYSIVQKDCESDEVVVRSRIRQDLVRLGKSIGVKVDIQTDAGTDYLFRAVFRKVELGEYLQQALLNLCYENFKDTIPPRNTRRRTAYQRCWEALLSWQEGARWLKRR